MAATRGSLEVNNQTSKHLKMSQKQWKIFLKALHNPVAQSFNFPLRYKG